MFLDRILNRVPKPAPKIKPMSICMMGARGVGKTSVITSMYYNHKDAVEGTDLFLLSEGSTSMILNNKKKCLEMMFAKPHAANERVQEAGIAGDSSESTFEFTYGMNSEKVNIGMEIRDYPGEYLLDNPETVAEYVREANAVLIAIDTPCMMELDGRFNEAKNRPGLVMDFLMNNLDKSGEKLVLLVPLKCEKYYAEGRIDEVTARVEEIYKPMLDYLRDRNDEHGFKKKICCAITPIQTLGSVGFDCFETDEQGNVKVINSGKDELPARVHYRYLKGNAAYEPQDCAQPLYYLMAFFAKQYDAMKEAQRTGTFLGRLMDVLRLIPNVEKFMLEVHGLGIKRRESGKGYKIVFGRGRI